MAQAEDLREGIKGLTAQVERPALKVAEVGRAVQSKAKALWRPTTLGDNMRQGLNAARDTVNRWRDRRTTDIALPNQSGRRDPRLRVRTHTLTKGRR